MRATLALNGLRDLNQNFNLEIIGKFQLDFSFALKSLQKVVFCKKCVLKNFAKFIENTYTGASFLIMSQAE